MRSRRSFASILLLSSVSMPTLVSAKLPWSKTKVEKMLEIARRVVDVLVLFLEAKRIYSEYVNRATERLEVSTGGKASETIALAWESDWEKVESKFGDLKDVFEEVKELGREYFESLNAVVQEIEDQDIKSEEREKNRVLKQRWSICVNAIESEIKTAEEVRKRGRDVQAQLTAQAMRNTLISKIDDLQKIRRHVNSISEEFERLADSGQGMIKDPDWFASNQRFTFISHEIPSDLETALIECQLRQYDVIDLQLCEKGRWSIVHSNGVSRSSNLNTQLKEALDQLQDASAKISRLSFSGENFGILYEVEGQKLLSYKIGEVVKTVKGGWADVWIGSHGDWILVRQNGELETSRFEKRFRVLRKYTKLSPEEKISRIDVSSSQSNVIRVWNGRLSGFGPKSLPDERIENVVCSTVFDGSWAIISKNPDPMTSFERKASQLFDDSEVESVGTRKYTR